MLLRAEIQVEIPEGTVFNSSWGSLMHGAVMETLPLGLSSSLHDQGLKPWSQFIFQIAPGKLVWVLSGLTDEISQALDQSILSKLPLTWNIRQKGFRINILSPHSLERMSYIELADRHFKSPEATRLHRIRFFTPTSFKTAGRQVIFPTTDLLMNSLMQRWDAFSKDLSLGDPEIRSHLADHVVIRDYRLSSASFSVNSAWLKGFIGQIDLVVTGPEALCRVASLLLDYGRFAGVGIKTTLGMGGMYFGKDRAVQPAGKDRPIS